MSFQSKTYSLSDEVVAVIDAARGRGITPNQLLKQAFGIKGNVRMSTIPAGNQPQSISVSTLMTEGEREHQQRTGTPIPLPTGVARGIRPKGDAKR